MKISSIILENFKSYYGHNVLGPFDVRMTAVIGPNGAGKSNLVESLLFVFGKRAPWMRAQQLHQLISRDSGAKSGSVEVLFELEDGERLSIKRIVWFSSTSQYELNGEKVSQESVISRLRGYGVDLQNNRFLVQQGEVEQIFMMKPRSGNVEQPGLLEYLEEVIGSNELCVRMEEMQERLECEQERRIELGERVR